MRYYLVDYENVHFHGIDTIHKLAEDDCVKVFYTTSNSNIPIALHKKIEQSKVRVAFFHVESGTKNALDFQLVSHLGFLIGENKKSESEYYIVSKDKGFSCVEEYWTKRQRSVYLVSKISQSEDISKLNIIVKKVEELGFASQKAKQIARIIQELKTKQGIHSRLLKEFQSKDNKVGSEIYKKIKPLISDKKGQ